MTSAETEKKNAGPGRIPKILLLTDMPPCAGYTGGLALDQMCRFLPQGSLACFAALSPGVEAQLSPALAGMRAEYRRKPAELVRRWLPGIPGAAAAFLTTEYRLGNAAGTLAKDAVRFGRDFGAEAVWCVLQGQTMIRIALPVAKGLGVPLRTWAWDPPGWWLRENGVDRVSRNRTLKTFGDALRGSASFGAASWAMAERYAQDYGVRAVPVIPGLDARFAFPPSGELRSKDRLIIGMAGQLYASQEWDALLRTLDAAGWKIAGRDVTIRLMGRYAHLSAPGPRRIEFLGWASQRETIRAMAESDILYCGYWFDPAFEEEARVGFPSKLTTYLASGRPVMFHGPAYASPARFLADHDAASACGSLDPRDIRETLERLSVDMALRERVAGNGSRAFHKHLSLDQTRRQFADFLEVPPGLLNEPGEIREGSGNAS